MLRQRIRPNTLSNNQYNLLEMGADTDNTCQQQQRQRKKNIIKYTLIICLFSLAVVGGIILSGVTLTFDLAIDDSTYDKYVGFRRIPEDNHICFNASNVSSYEPYLKQLDNFINTYKFGNNKAIKCDGKEKIPNQNQVCHINETWIWPCGKTDWYYDNGWPCVILYYDPSLDEKDKVRYNPQPYQKLEEIPDYAPEQIREIASEERNNNLLQPLVRLYCSHVDIHNYHPTGFYNYFFIHPNISGYLKPMISIQFNFTNYKNEINAAEYHVECRLWSRTPFVKEVKKVSFKISQGKIC